jgi:sirohydrochlorin ferrochelatase
VSTAVVFIAHGSRAAAANEAHHAAAAELGDRLGLPVHAAFLELAEPSIPEAIVAAADAGAARVLVLPYFLYPGRHVATDIPEMVAEARAARPDAHVELLEAFGADPTVLGVLADQVRRAGLSSSLPNEEE